MNTARRGRGRGRGRPRGSTTASRYHHESETAPPPGTLFKCPACQLVFSTESDMTNHKMTHSELYDYECGQCDLVFETLDVLKKHFYSAHMVGGGDGGDERLSENVQSGGGGLANSAAAARVTTIGSSVDGGDGNSAWGGSDTFNDDGDDDGGYDGGGVSPDEEEEKDKRADDASQGRVEENPVGGSDNSSNGKLFQCDHCPKSYRFKNDLTIHLRSHTGERPYQCPECGKTFSIHKTMREHVQRHNSEFKYFCEVVGCGKGFVKKQDRDRHEIRAHVPISQRPKDESNQCSVCDKFFTQKAHLKEHMKMHDGVEGDYPCELCGKRFGKMSNLKVHMMSQKHGGPGVSARNKKKPKKTPVGGVSRRGRKRKVPERFIEKEEEEEEEESEEDIPNDKTDDEYVPPGDKRASRGSAPSNGQLGYGASAQAPVIVAPQLKLVGAPQLLPHQQPQGPPPQISTISDYQQQQINPNYWRNSNGQQQSQQNGQVFYGQGQQQQVVSHPLLHIPVGVLTLQDAFQMGYGIGGSSGGGGGS